jgi:hypothetical protein
MALHESFIFQSAVFNLGIIVLYGIAEPPVISSPVTHTQSTDTDEICVIENIFLALLEIFSSSHINSDAASVFSGTLSR